MLLTFENVNTGEIVELDPDAPEFDELFDKLLAKFANAYMREVFPNLFLVNCKAAGE